MISHENIIVILLFMYHLKGILMNSIKTGLDLIWSVFISKKTFSFHTKNILLNVCKGVKLWIWMKTFYGKLDNAYYFFEMELQTVEIVKNNYHTSQEKWLNKFGIQNTTTCYTQKLKVFIYLFWKVYNYEASCTWIWNAFDIPWNN